VIAVGVDGCRGGWVAVALSVESLALLDVAVTGAFADVVERAHDADVIGVDMPIGLPAGGAPRPCDLAARTFVGARRASVFLVPPASAFAMATHTDAVTECRRLGAPGVSLQAWGLRHRIAEVARVCQDTRIVEVFPEAAFRHLAGRDLPSKKTAEGRELRGVLLHDAGVRVDLAMCPRGAALDDLLDAAAVAWSAARIARGDASHLPPDGDGPFIWY